MMSALHASWQQTPSVQNPLPQSVAAVQLVPSPFMVPGLAAIKRAALDAGALGSSLSGSGPSLFALCTSRAIAGNVAGAMTAAVAKHIGGESQTYISEVAEQGARVI